MLNCNREAKLLKLKANYNAQKAMFIATVL